MTLPAITVPAAAPLFLASGHSVTEDSVYAPVRAATGSSRQRRVWTVTERIVTVEWLLEAAVLTDVEAWFEDVLQAGARTFSVQLRNEGAVPGFLWWEARWISFEVQMLHFGRGRVTGQLMLFGEGSAEGPERGVLAFEVSLPLDDVPAPVFIPVEYGMELQLPLGQGVVVPPTRITEDGENRITEDGELRILESFL